MEDIKNLPLEEQVEFCKHRIEMLTPPESKHEETLLDKYQELLECLIEW